MRNMTRDQLQSRLRNWLMRRTTNSAVRRVGELPLAIGTDIGSVRSENQDRVAVLRVQASQHHSFVAAVLCDGMGGMAEGANCAALAVSGFLTACIHYRGFDLHETVLTAAHEANKLVNEAFDGRGGATLSAIVIDSLQGAVGVNVGDSRIYAYRNSALQQLTVDDTIAGQFQRDGDKAHRGNELLQFIGIGDGLEPHIILAPDDPDLLVLTSDGVHYIDKYVMQMLIQHAKEPAIAVRRLAEISKWCGGHDNASTAVVSPVAMRLPPSDEIGTVQIWDPFGELLILGPEPSENGRQRESQKPPPQELPTKRASKQGKKPRPSKKKDIDIHQDEHVPEPEESVRPQLKIEFDDEANGGGLG